MTSHDPQTIQKHIQLEAYLLSERAGHPAGMDRVFWTQAEAIVHSRAAVVAPAISAPKAARKPAAKKPAAKKPAAKSKTASADQPKLALDVEPKKPAAKRAKK